MDYKTFMERVGVKRKATVNKWLEAGNIPGAVFNEEVQEWEFSESSRRPHTVRLKPNADANKLRASMVYACIKRHHISAGIYQIGDTEFNALITDLINAGLVQIRQEGIWTYYDSTTKSQEYSRRNYAQIEKFVKECIAVACEATAKGIAKAVIETGSNGTAAA